jgi:putative membrane protein
MNRRMKIMALAAVGMLLVSFSPLLQAQAPTDPQIVGIVVAANQIDIDHAKIALKKSKNKEVKDFAQQMITDHSAVQKSVFDLGAKLKVTPADSDTSKSLKDQAAKTDKELRSLSGKAFDKAYLQNEVSYHKAVIDALNSTLIPNAKNAELKGALTGVLPAFQGHMEHAQKVLSDLEK